MAFQRIRGGFWLPEPFRTDAGDPRLALTIDAVGEMAGAVVKAPRTGNISHVIYSLMTVSVTSGPLNFDCRLETITTSTGINSGTLLGTNSNGADPIADTDDNDQRRVALTTPVAVVEGVTDIAFVLNAPGSGTFNVQLATLGGDFVNKFPYCLTNGTKTLRVPVLAFEYDDGEVYAPPGCFPCEVIGSTTFNSSSNPDERGNKFQYPVPVGIDAVSILGDPTAGGTFDIRISAADGSEIMTITLDTDYHIDQSDGSMMFPLEEDVADILKFAANEAFFVTVLPDANNFELYHFDVESAYYMDGFDGGQLVHGCNRNNLSGVPTDETTRRYFVAVRVAALDDGAGGGGGGLAANVFNGSVIN